jgi:hypothetical protein
VHSDQERRWIFLLKYETPDMKVIYFEAEDILTTSTGEGEDPW